MTRMEKRRPSQSTAVFAYPELFPADMRLLLDGETHTALFVSLEAGDARPVFRSLPLTPASATIFLALLQAYPAYCSHRVLYRCLYPSPESDDEDAWWGQVKDLALPMIRRALKTLLPALRICGLQVVSLRGQGYLLTSATTAKERQEEAPQEGKTGPSCCTLPSIRAPCGR